MKELTITIAENIYHKVDVTYFNKITYSSLYSTSPLWFYASLQLLLENNTGI